MCVRICFALQNSVPHLKTRLQLQQAIMKELLQRQAMEKQQKQSQIAPQQQLSQQHASLQPQVNQQPLQLPQPTPPQVGSQLSVQQQQVALLQRRLSETSVVPQVSTVSVQQQQQHGASVSVPSPQTSVAAPLPSQPNQALSVPPASLSNQVLSRDQMVRLTPEQQQKIGGGRGRR